jgi:hypothetical protein
MSEPLTPYSAAPIIRYSDPRLYGTALVKPFAASYGWVVPVTYPIFYYSTVSIIAEFAMRLFNALLGCIGMAVTALPALVGRLIQALHYHCKSVQNRQAPTAIAIKVTTPQNQKTTITLPIHLPPFACPSQQYNGMTIYYDPFEETKLHQILRGNRDLLCGMQASSEPCTNNTALRFSLKLKREEVLTIDSATHNEWLRDLQERVFGKQAAQRASRTTSGQLEDGGWYISQECVSRINYVQTQKVHSIIQRLLLQNGYRALQIADTPKLAIYDPTCLPIPKLQGKPSPPSRRFDGDPGF